MAKHSHVFSLPLDADYAVRLSTLAALVSKGLEIVDA
jgi:hypothetical protein